MPDVELMDTSHGHLPPLGAGVDAQMQFGPKYAQRAARGDAAQQGSRLLGGAEGVYYKAHVAAVLCANKDVR